MTLVLDAGALIAIERSDREVLALLKSEMIAARVPVTHGGVVGQVWRAGGPRQAVLARALAGIEIVALDETLGRQAGALLAQTDQDDVVDAALAVLAGDDDIILTSDPSDLVTLSSIRGAHVEIVRV